MEKTYFVFELKVTSADFDLSEENRTQTFWFDRYPEYIAFKAILEKLMKATGAALSISGEMVTRTQQKNQPSPVSAYARTLADVMKIDVSSIRMDITAWEFSDEFSPSVGKSCCGAAAALAGLVVSHVAIKPLPPKQPAVSDAEDYSGSMPIGDAESPKRRKHALNAFD